MVSLKKASIIFGSSFLIVFRRPAYIWLASIIGLVLFLFIIWLPNLSFYTTVLTSATFDLGAKVGIFWSSLGIIKTNFSPLGRNIAISVVLLSGINIAMLIYYLRRRISLEKSVGTSLVGTLLGLVGVGCASCGSVILSSFFGVATTAGFVSVLPLRGSEFGLVGIIILLISIYSIANKIQNPLVCKITPN